MLLQLRLPDVQQTHLLYDDTCSCWEMIRQHSQQRVTALTGCRWSCKTTASTARFYHLTCHQLKQLFIAWLQS